jgi:microcystin-dependent protein
MARQYGYLTGDLAAADGVICRRLIIPNQIDYLAAVNGAILELSQSYNWEQFGADTPDEAAAAMWQMYLEFRESEGCMIGAIVPYGTEFPPPGCLPCDGSTFQREDYPILYDRLHPDLILNADEFQTPDLRNVFVAGAGDNYSSFETGGADTVTLTESEMPSHTHIDAGHLHSVHDHLASIALLPDSPPISTPSPIPGATGSASANIQATGGDDPHENRPPFMALPYCMVAR